MEPESGVRIVARRKATQEEWGRIGSGSREGTFFHTHLWADIFRKAFRGRMVPVPRLVQFDDGAEILIPLVSRTVFGLAGLPYWSMPAYTYGGWLSPTALTDAHGRAVAAELLSLCDLVWRENPYDPVIAGLDLSRSIDDFTQAVDLRDGMDAAEKRFDHAHRKAVKKAARSGVTVAEASRFDEWLSYFSLYGDSRRRWQSKNLLRNRGFGLAMFRAIYESPAEHRKLWLARVNGECAAGIICFYWKGHAVAWNGAGAARFFDCRPNNLLYEHAIRQAAEAGNEWFDCNPSGGLAGVVEFKEHLGARRLRSRVIEKRSPVRRAAELVRRVLP
jgi:hypothetical protein